MLRCLKGIQAGVCRTAGRKLCEGSFVAAPQRLQAAGGVLCPESSLSPCIETADR